MKKEFEAHYSKTYASIFAFLLLLFLFVIIMFSIFWLPDMSLAVIIILSLVSVVWGFMLIITIRKDGIAVQVQHDYDSSIPCEDKGKRVSDLSVENTKVILFR